MLKKIAMRIKGWMLIAAFLGLVIFAMIINGEPFGTSALQSQYGIELLDMRMHYEPTDIEVLLSQLVGGADNLYRNIVTMDLFFPPFYGLALFLAIGFLLKRSELNGSIHNRWFLLMLVPVIATFFDYAENMCTLLILNSYQFFVDAGVYNVMHIFTKLKFLFVGLSGAVVLGGIIRLCVQAFKKRT